MVLKIVYYFVILLFNERFLGGNLDVVISLLLILCESLGINIMSIVLLLNGGEWCELWSKGATRLQISRHSLEDKWARLVLCVDVESNLECCCVLQK